VTRKITKAIRDEMVRLRCAERLTVPQVAKRVGLCHHTAYKYLKKFKDAPTDVTPRIGKRATWSPDEIEILKRLWSSATVDELKAALPRRVYTTMGKKASDLGLTRLHPSRAHKKHRVHPLIAQLEQARMAQNRTIKEVAEKSGHHPVEMHEWEMGKKSMRFLTFLDVANALGFDVVLRPRIAEVMQQDRKKMMGAR